MPPGQWQVSVLFQGQIGLYSGSAIVDLAAGDAAEITVDLRCVSGR
jgi:hypothetical protein